MPDYCRFKDVKSFGEVIEKTFGFFRIMWSEGKYVKSDIWYSDDTLENLEMLPDISVGQVYTAPGGEAAMTIGVTHAYAMTPGHATVEWIRGPRTGTQTIMSLMDFFDFFHPPTSVANGPAPDKTSAAVKKCKRFVPVELPKYYMYSEEELQFQTKKLLTRTLREWPKCVADGMTDLVIETHYDVAPFPDRTQKLMVYFACKHCKT